MVTGWLLWLPSSSVHPLSDDVDDQLHNKYNKYEKLPSEFRRTEGHKLNTFVDSNRRASEDSFKKWMNRWLAGIQTLHVLIKGVEMIIIKGDGGERTGIDINTRRFRDDVVDAGWLELAATQNDEMDHINELNPYPLLSSSQYAWVVRFSGCWSVGR